jgi:sugar lactone lactonase YvrE
MKKSVVLLVLISLSLTILGVIFAKASPEIPSEADDLFQETDDWPGRFRGMSSDKGDSIQSTASFSVGDPGISFRYVEEFGEAEVPYFDDSSHLNVPFGLGAIGNNIWITELEGFRALKYRSDGVLLDQIGTAGIQFGHDEFWITPLHDIAQDSLGNIWLVNHWSDVIIKLNSSQELLFMIGEEWVEGTDSDHLANPRGIAIDSANNIYISDAGNHRVQIFDDDGNYQATIGQSGVSGSGNDQLDSPRRLIVDGTTLYIVDSGNQRVQVFDVSNFASITYLDTLGVTGVSGSDNDHFDWPVGVAVGNGYIYVADLHNHRIQIFDAATRNYQATLGSYGTGNNQFNEPADVAVDNSGNLYVADHRNFRVQQFNSSLVYQRSYGTLGVPYLTDGYHYNVPRAKVDANGNIYVIEELGHRLLKLDYNGDPIWIIGEAGVPGWDNAHFSYPHGVAVRDNGLIYVADSCRVQIFNENGVYQDTLGTGCGDGPYEFDWAAGVGVDTVGNIYVADAGNHRVMIYNSSLSLIDQIGLTGVCDSANDRLCEPIEVEIDSSGNVYVADASNARLQVFDSNLDWVMTIGETGNWGNSFSQFDSAEDVAIDAEGRIYVSDIWNNRVQVFENDGDYLATIGGNWSSRRGEVANASSVDVDKNGFVYLGDFHNGRIQKFAFGVPGWKQVNINGFGDIENSVSTLDVFEDYLYAGTWYTEGPDQVWRMNLAGNWEDVSPPWSLNSWGLLDAQVFNSEYYIGSRNEDGCELWRTNGSTWEQIFFGGLGDTNNIAVSAMSVFSNTLYIALGNTSTGTEIWRSTTGNPGSWSQVNTDGFGDDGTAIETTMDVFGNYLYVGLGRGDPLVGELWRTSTGTDWSPVFTNGLGNSNNTWVSSMAEFGGNFFIGFRNLTTGGEVWRSENGVSWSPVFTSGLGNPNNLRPYGLIVHDGDLYLVFVNTVDGAEVWSTSDGVNWHLIMESGWGNSLYVSADYFDKGAVVFDSNLYIGTLQDGGKVWQFLPPYYVYLPVTLNNP